MFKSLIAGVLVVNGVSAVALNYESVPWDWETEYGWLLPTRNTRAATPAPVKQPKKPEPVKKAWRQREYKYDFPGRTDWGEDPDHFNWNNGGYSSHLQYGKKLDFDSVLRPWRTKAKKSGKEEDSHTLEHHFSSKHHADSDEESEDEDAHVPGQFYPAGHLEGKKGYGGHALGNFNVQERDDDPIPDAFDYSGLQWATKKGVNKLSHHGADLPKLRKTGYSKYSYLKGAEDFPDTECYWCHDHDHHALDKEDTSPYSDWYKSYQPDHTHEPNTGL